MQAILTENREKIVALCRTHHVLRLAVFGSAVRDDFDVERSDVDFLVRFGSPDSFRYAPNFFSLLRSLEALLGREVDLVIEGTIRNPIILKYVEEQEEVFYAA